MISIENRIIVSNDFSNQKGFNIVFGMYFFIVIQYFDMNPESRKTFGVHINDEYFVIEYIRKYSF